MTATSGLRRRQIALIHVARRDLGLTDDAYRALLEGAAGVTSAADITTDAQFDSVMATFKAAGFVPRPPRFASDRDHASDHTRSTAGPWRCYVRQRRKIEAMWRDRARVRTAAALASFCRRTTGCDPQFMTAEQASHVIVALEKL